jgi:hypothetical protein
VLPASSRGPLGGRRARRGLAGLTEVVARRRSGEVARCDGARWGPHRREGRRRLQLAPGAVGEDKRGEGGSKSRNEDGLTGLNVGRGNGGGRKRTKDRGGSGLGSGGGVTGNEEGGEGASGADEKETNGGGKERGGAGRGGGQRGRCGNGRQRHGPDAACPHSRAVPSR